MKPESVRRVDLKRSIEAAINEAQLPPYVIEPVIADVLEKIRLASMRQYQADLAAWTEAQKKEEEDAQQNVQD